MIIQQHAGSSPAKHAPRGDVAPLTGRWSWSYDSQNEAATVVAKVRRSVLIASGDTYNVNCITALDPGDGHVEWTQPRAFLTNLLPTLGSDNNLYGAAFDRNAITVRDPQTGAVSRTLEETFAPNTRCALGTDGTIYVGGSASRNDADDEALYALDPATGQEKWHIAMPLQLSAAPIVGPDVMVYCNTTDGHIVAVDGTTGKTRWTFSPGTPITQPVAVGPRGTLYAIDQHSTVYALNPHQNGSAQATWSKTLDTPVDNLYGLPSLDVSQPLVVSAENEVYAAASGHSVRALQGDTGTQAWEQPIATYQSPVLDLDGHVLVSEDDGAVVQLDPKSGTPVGEWCAADPIKNEASPAPPVVTNAAPGQLIAL